MNMNRRGFLASTAAFPFIAQCAAEAGGAKYKACIIGDTNEGGYGHSMHVAFANRPDVRVVALADPDEAGGAKHAAEAKAERTYADYREMLEKEKPDLVSVGPRTTVRHKEYVLACAEHGCHGFLEKPIAADLAEADEMAAAIEAKNLKWAMAHNYRMSPPVRHMKKMLLEEHIIGHIIELRSHGKEDNRAGGEDMIVLGTHVFDLVQSIMGKPEWCMADITVNGKPAKPSDVKEATEPLGPIVGNRINAMFGLGKGIAMFFGSIIQPDGDGKRWGLDIYGSKGVIKTRLNGLPPSVTYLPDPSWAPGLSGIAWAPLPDAPAEVTMQNPDVERNAPIIDDLIAAIEEDRIPEASLQDGRTAYEFIQGAFAAYINGGRVSLPVAQRAHPLKHWA
ncbi:MAG TPA: Gfo/Idh/MocA family oxidoreductase [Candidatus Hydrogenedentes bacterium]|nr:Gfo/Idh/MocA family oxidoreductase [Candidatus Hydrogenedentota bacterium]